MDPTTINKYPLSRYFRLKHIYSFKNTNYQNISPSNRENLKKPLAIQRTELTINSAPNIPQFS